MDGRDCLCEPFVKTLGQHKTTLLSVGRVVGHIQLYVEQERGGGGGGQIFEESRHQYILGPGLSGGGALFYLDAPLS